jgi:hypothetical protein
MSEEEIAETARLRARVEALTVAVYVMLSYHDEQLGAPCGTCTLCAAARAALSTEVSTGRFYPRR